MLYGEADVLLSHVLALEVWQSIMVDLMLICMMHASLQLPMLVRAIKKSLLIRVYQTTYLCNMSLLLCLFVVCRYLQKAG